MRVTHETICQKLKHGRLSRLHYVRTPSGFYRKALYSHPMGEVQVYCEAGSVVISTYHKGQIHTRSRTDHPTPGQISNFCRKLLLDLNPPTNAIIK